MQSVSLELKEVTCSYDEALVLQQISLCVSQGDFVGIIGPNGSGKTSLLKAISRVLKPKFGIVCLDGENIFQFSQRKTAQNMAVVAQETPINFAFTAFEIVLMGRSPHLGRFEVESSQDLVIVRQAMEKTNTLYLADRHITELSGGEKQRVIIAQAIAQEPRLLLLDEPTSHLDINHQLQILDLIRGLNDDGLAVIAVFHDFNLASHYSDCLVLLNAGQIHTLGLPEEVLTRENISQVFGVDVHIDRHPVTGELYVSPIPKNAAMGSKRALDVCQKSEVRLKEKF